MLDRYDRYFKFSFISFRKSSKFFILLIMHSFFFLLFLSLCISKPITLTDKNYQEITTSTNGRPIFVEVWDKHFYQSKSYKDSWKKIASSDKFKDKVIFADLNCHYESLTCQRICPGRVFPRFVWINGTTGATTQYSGGVSPDEVKNWISSQLSDAIEKIESNEKMKEILPISVKMSLFKFSIFENDKNSLEIAQQAAELVKHLQIKMVLVTDQEKHEPKLIHYTPDHREVVFEGEFTVENLKKFIKIHAIRFFAPYSETINHFSQVEEMPVEVFLYPHKNELFKKKAIDIAKSVENLIPTVQTGCEYSNTFCRYVGVGSDRVGVAVIIDKHNNLFWVHNLDRQVYNWTLDVLNGKERGSGPGTGVLKEYLMLFYDMRAKGGWPYYFVFLPFGVMIFAVFIAIFVLAFSIDPTKGQKYKKE
ncbi:hypothetical protein TRFO_04654 [Tritrichomonas foetus]|uniref:Thioredoxin domain-containing protein n=1 Tax=Tritrichomonas foetus TaxID=1144522 RepID=A0A1J4KGX7_9EUKA|nr:hypothetical protein TRFO_04654 [Tritrichomonas foetus]|eukprot:OHT09076.1 hypothetical protein TRFO_04654 [Tritrichomonas foetus]